MTRNQKKNQELGDRPSSHVALRPRTRTPQTQWTGAPAPRSPAQSRTTKSAGPPPSVRSSLRGTLSEKRMRRETGAGLRGARRGKAGLARSARRTRLMMVANGRQSEREQLLLTNLRCLLRLEKVFFTIFFSRKIKSFDSQCHIQNANESG